MSASAARRLPARIDWRAIDALGVRGLSVDSRAVRRGEAFVAYPGEQRDGRRFIPQAIARGASAVLWEAQDYSWRRSWRVPNLAVRELRRHAGEIAAHVYGRPTEKLWMIGVTGTNGKTSCSQWIAQALARTGRRAAVIGTIGYGEPARLKPAPNTTPEAVWVQRVCAGWVKQGYDAVAMEVSSIGLAQDRHRGIDFDVALLTNVTRDHLDYHGTMRRYRAAKARLFASPSLQHAVLNLDDAFGRELVERVSRRGTDAIGYGFGPARARRLARVRGSNLEVGPRGVAFDIASPWGRGRLESPLLGRFNAANLLGTLAVLLASDVRLEEAIAALERVAPAPGRLERLGGGGKPLAVIDYAHSPDALANALGTLREILDRGRVPGGLVCVFGCGGDRDRGKRPLMGEIATRIADRVIVTSDNPRSEPPQRIAAEIAAGAAGDCEIELDRGRAIRRAIGTAGPDDIVLVAGKGHETWQEIAGRCLPFSDRKAVAAALARWRVR